MASKITAGNPLGTTITEGELAFTDVTTANVSTTKHGLAPKLDNNAAHFLNGQGGYTTPAGGVGGSTGATDNAILRADGTGGATAQNSLVRISDSGNILIANNAQLEDADGNVIRFQNNSGLFFFDANNNVGATLATVALSSTNRSLQLPDTDGVLVAGTAVGTTVGATGGATVLPAFPLGYVTVILPNGATAKIPYYNS